MIFYILLASCKLASPLFLEQKETELAEAIRQGARLYQKFSRNVSSIVTTENNVCWSRSKSKFDYRIRYCALIMDALIKDKSLFFKKILGTNKGQILQQIPYKFLRPRLRYLRDHFGTVHAGARK